jgi:hypothetical protein
MSFAPGQRFVDLILRREGEDIGNNITTAAVFHPRLISVVWILISKLE